jgi:hypothetical protein
MRNLALTHILAALAWLAGCQGLPDAGASHDCL